MSDDLITTVLRVSFEGRYFDMESEDVQRLAQELTPLLKTLKEFSTEPVNSPSWLKIWVRVKFKAIVVEDSEFLHFCVGDIPKLLANLEAELSLSQKLTTALNK